MHIVKAPFILRTLFPEATWNKSRKERKIYLTFDDGPIPEITPWVLDTLNQYNIKATFFCVGENIVKHPEIFERIKQEGHRIGNHTFNHLRGWDTPQEIYIENVQKCQELTQTNLLRPPYGRAKKTQMKVLKQEYEIIMWDVLTGDYDNRISPKQCLKNCVKYTKNGSIIVFHDSLKAEENIRYALPKAIEQLLQKGFTFDVL